MLNKSARYRFGSKAQAMVEFALVLPILLLIIIGIFEAGRLLFYYVAVNTASRDAARYGATVGTNGGVAHYYDCATITQIAQSRGFIATINNVTIQYDSGPQANGVNPTPFGNCAGQPTLPDGSRIVVTASALFTPIVRELGGIRIFNDITVRSTSYRTIMSRTYLPQQVSYESTTTSTSTGTGTGTSTTSSATSSSSPVLRACVFQIITPDSNLNRSITDATWEYRNSDTVAVSVPSLTILSGDPANPNQPARITQVVVGGSPVYNNPSGELNVTVNGPWTVNPGADLNIRIVYTNGIRIKDVTINPVIDAQPTCKYPFP